MLVIRPAPGQTFPEVTVQRIADLLKDHDYTKPIVLSDGDMRLDVIGGLTFVVHLDGGPLDGLRCTLDIPNLDALPPVLSVKGGGYHLHDQDPDPYLMRTTHIWRTAEGDPTYRWVEAEAP